MATKPNPRGKAGPLKRSLHKKDRRDARKLLRAAANLIDDNADSLRASSTVVKGGIERWDSVQDQELFNRERGMASGLRALADHFTVISRTSKCKRLVCVRLSRGCDCF